MIADIIHKVASMTYENDLPFSFRASSAGPERCIRQMVYHGLGIKKQPLPGRAVVIFSDSSFHEDLTADWIRQSAYHLHSEQMHVNIPTGHKFLKERECSCGEIIRDGCIGGHIDGILTNPMLEDFLWEHKAINHFTFQRYWDGVLPMDYITQCCEYIRGLNPYNKDLTKANLLIKNKNTAQYMEFNLSYNIETDTATVYERVNSQGEKAKMNSVFELITNSAFQKFQDVYDYIQIKTLPKRQYHINDDWQCEYCQWGKTCWEGYEKEFTELKTDTMLPNEIADMLRYYKELGAQKKDITDEHDSLRKQVKNMLIDAGTRGGRAGEYVCRLALIKTSRVDKDLLTPAEIERATKETFQERLFISKPTEVTHG